MAPGKRVSVKREKSMDYGRKVVQLHVGPNQEVFTIHEDLLCAHSSFFRQKVQEISPAIEGNCAICHEDLQPSIMKIAFCSAPCGSNIHYDCMQQQKEENTDTKENIICPLCHAAWAEEEIKQFHGFPDFDASDFEFYSEWIYTGQISVGKSGVTFLKLMEGYVLGVHLGDRSFRSAIMDCFLEKVEDMEKTPNHYSIELAYQKLRVGDAMRCLLVDLFVSRATVTSLEGDHRWKKYPAEFLKDVAIALLHARDPKELDFAAIKERYHELEEKDAAS